MPITDKLAREVLAKLNEQDAVILEKDAVITDLQKRLGITDELGSAIQKSVERPSFGQPRNKLVSDAVRAGIFKSEKPVSKVARQQSEADRRRQLRRELQVAKGLRPKDG